MQQAREPSAESLTIHHFPVSQGDEVAELIAGLSASQPSISPPFFLRPSRFGAI